MKKSIFVVEDHLAVRQAIVQTINREADMVVCGEADDALPAFEGVRGARPDLVLIDIQLKSSSGLELIRKLRRHFSSLPLVCMTLLDRCQYEKRARDNGANGFLVKQEGPEKMLAAIRDAVSARQTLEVSGIRTDSDSEWVRRAKAGELAAFEALVTRHERRVYTVVRRITGNDLDAEDVTQQTFLSALEHLEGFREEASFSTWLQRIATHAALKVIRKRKGLPTVSLEQSTESQDGYETVPHPEYIADWSESPERLVQRRETARLIDGALSRLDEKHRLVFLLRDVEGFSVKETASELGLSETNVKVRLLRARLQLREQLTAAFGDPATRLEPHRHERD